MDVIKLLKENFICQDEVYGTQYNRKNAPLFRKDFNITNFKEAKLYICGLGFYDLFINGNKITKGKMAPYFSNPNDMIYYDEYDVSNILNNGDNAISVLLGTGWLNPIGGDIWGFTEASWRSSNRLSLVLVVDNKVTLVSDESFKVKPSHIIFDSLRCGEYVDNRIYNKNDYLFGNIDNSFKDSLRTNAPKGEMTLCTSDPISVVEVRKPLSIKKVDDGYIYDYGENLAGVPRIRIKGHPGQTVQIWCFEVLVDGTFYNKNTCTPDADRYMSQKDILICSGNEDYFEPSFTYHGFRYIYLEGSEGVPCDLDMVVLCSKIKHRGFFECDNDVINGIQHITCNSDISNFYYFPTDCPQREKNGWTGDAQLSCEQMLYNYDTTNSLTVWLNNIRKAQREDGVIPGVIPTYKFGYDWGNGPMWDNVLIELPYQIYRFKGNKQILLDNKDAIFKYLSVNMKNKVNADGLIAYGLCDWCEAGSILEYICSTPIEITDSLTVIEMLKNSAKMFETVGELDRVKFCFEFANELTNNFRNKHIKDNKVDCNTQTAQAMAIHAGVFKEDELEDAVNNLVALIHENDDLMKYGVAGNKVIYDVLTDYGYGNLAIKLITQDKFPSFKYWLDNDATSLWEAFNEVEANKVMRKDGGRVLSLNHHFWGTVSAYFYKYIAGIIVNPNFNNPNELVIKPYLFKDINHVKCSYKNNENEIVFEVNKVNNNLEINIISNKGFIIVK